MNRARLLLPVAIFIILGVVGNSYYHRMLGGSWTNPVTPPRLPENTRTVSKEWHYTEYENNRARLEGTARDFRMGKDSNVIELEGVLLHIFDKRKQQSDLVKSEKANFSTADGVMNSDGDVEITLGVPDSGPPKEKLLMIRALGARYETKTGKVKTDKAASFKFDRGEGKSVGATYDPATKELHMLGQVELHWRGDERGKDMTVQAGELTYKENEHKVYLGPWSKLLRGTLTLNAADSIVTLKDGQIDVVDAQHAQGADEQPGRKVEYAADQMHMQFGDNGEVQTIDGTNNAKLVSTSATAHTTVTSQKVNLSFDVASGASTLQKAVATGQAVVDAQPVPRPNVPPAETKILRSEVVVMSMRPNGQEIDQVVTEAPGSLEFVPNHAGQRPRKLDGDRFTIRYGADNVVQGFRSVNVATRTENEPKKGQKTAPPSLTWSKELAAEFDAAGQMTKMEQWDNFRYEEGTRKAKSDHATLEQNTGIITLDGVAKVLDDTGSTAADHIVLLQKTNETRADGNVVSLRLPEQKKSDTSLLAADEPLQAKALKMVSTDKNEKVHYEGNAILWQGVNRLQADKIDIDRKTGDVQADGNVISQFVEKDKDEKDSKAKKPANTPAIFTVIRAPEMTYNDHDRVAHYQGGTLLNRPGLDVKSQELRAFLKQEKSGDSSLDHAFADGQVEILERKPERSRQGYGDHAEYYLDEEKIFIQGGASKLVDSLRGTVNGETLTYFSNNDRLIVDGKAGKLAVSDLKQKKHRVVQMPSKPK